MQSNNESIYRKNQRKQLAEAKKALIDFLEKHDMRIGLKIAYYQPTNQITCSLILDTAREEDFILLQTRICSLTGVQYHFYPEKLEANE